MGWDWYILGSRETGGLGGRSRDSLRWAEGRARVLLGVVVRMQRVDCGTLDPSAESVREGPRGGVRAEMGTRSESGLLHMGLRDTADLEGRSRASPRWAEGRARVLLGVVVRM